MAIASPTSPGSVILTGDLDGTATFPQLASTGVGFANLITPTIAPAITVDPKGRLLYCFAHTAANWAASPAYVARLATWNAQLAAYNVAIAGWVATWNGMITTWANTKATTTSVGRILQGGSGITYTAGVASLTTIANATTTTYGIVQVGTGLSVASGVLSGNAYTTLATSSVAGVVKLGGAGMGSTSGQLEIGAAANNAVRGAAFLPVVGSGLKVVSAPAATFALADNIATGTTMPSNIMCVSNMYDYGNLTNVASGGSMSIDLTLGGPMKKASFPLIAGTSTFSYLNVNFASDYTDYYIYYENANASVIFVLAPSSSTSYNILKQIPQQAGGYYLCTVMYENGTVPVYTTGYKIQLTGRGILHIYGSPGENTGFPYTQITIHQV